MGLMVLLSAGCIDNKPVDGGKKTETIKETCKNMCGDGVCEEIVCEAVGCPCAETKDSCPQDCTEKIGLPNPASVYCEKQGGKPEIRSDSLGGQYGVCVLSDSRECEEWEYYRSGGRKCIQYFDPDKPASIEGERDIHGCLLSAGYSWCASKNRCVKTGEEECIEAGVGISNPASSYCYESGGLSQIRNNKDGSQYGVCRLKNGSECEEWSYYRSEGKECIQMPEYTVAEVLNVSCLKDEECKTPERFLILSDCGYTSKCINNSCAVICRHPLNIAEEKEAFCGTSTNAACTSDRDCFIGGCSGQICAGRGENPVSTCEYRDCYNAAEYNLSCRCVEGKCRWN